MTELNTHGKIEIINVSRRGLLKGVAATGAFALAVQIPGVKGALADYPTGATAMAHGTVNNPKVFISIAGDGTVSIIAARAEMGNGAARTALPMMVADELEADWAKVRVVQSPGDERTYGNQDTDGSRSVRHWIQPMRQCGAAARAMLEQAAAAEWKVGAGEVEAKLHEVVHKPTGRKLGYGQLAAAASALPVPTAEKIKLKEASAFRYIGKGSIGISDLFDITTGRAIYGQDVMLPGMKFAVIARPPVLGGKVATLDASAALKVPGVEKVVTLPPPPRVGYKFAPLGGVAVIASNTWAALKGRDALKITWDDGPNKVYDSKTYRAQLEAASRKPGKVERNVGDAEKALSSAAKVITAEYYAPHIHHATMEPPAAAARMNLGRWEVWAPVQSPGAARNDVAAALGITSAELTLYPTLLGGGFGRKSKCDFAIEAALLSKELGGTPVKVVWTREDDVRHGFYHTVTAERFEAGVDAKGKVVAWRHRSTAPSILSTFAPDPKHPFAVELGMGWVDTPFDVPNIRMESGEAPAHVRIGWFRSVNNVVNAWSIQSFVAEMAAQLGKDPKDFLLELIGPARIVDPGPQVTTPWWNYGEPKETFPVDTGRLRNVVEIAAKEAGWGKALPKGQGLGIAAHRSFVSYIATAVHVVVGDNGEISIPRVDTAIDCGYCVHPERVRSQMEGAAVMGLSLAKSGAITFKNGAVEQANFNDYPVARIDEAPLEVRVHIVPHGIDVPPSGVGEPGVPPFAPALCNAIFAATGKRIKELPIGDQLA
ncbi:MAG TPA: molybdopterin cofactor-binding domain-containing protein [Hyphomicrobiaceae bacterium]|nr:molybdopterin cofactor-binding domain-containing protein [Hyphomicrobiaceae bacterium]